MSAPYRLRVLLNRCRHQPLHSTTGALRRPKHKTLEHRVIRQFSIENDCHSSATIFSVASGRSKAAVALIRISGPQCLEALTKLTPSNVLPKPRQMALCELRNPSTNEILDKAMVVWFRSPASFTGEDVAELHVHGSSAVIRDVLKSLSSLENLRPALPGEFTRRAFSNGKLDLTQAEALADLINSDTTYQKRMALNSISGGYTSRRYDQWRKDLIRSIAHLESFIDFGEEEDIGTAVLDDVLKNVSIIRGEIDQFLIDGRCSERIQTGVTIAIFGMPNVGKSSLLNEISRRDVAIVSDKAGTTRDIVEVATDLNGISVLFRDTAGIREGQEVEEVEREGIRRAKEAAAKADIRICVHDLADSESEKLCHCKQQETSHDNAQKIILVLNKADAAQDVQQRKTQECCATAHSVHTISCKTGEGLSSLITNIEQVAKGLCGVDSEGNFGHVWYNSRHQSHLQDCVAALDQALHRADDVVLMAEELRFAVQQFGYITGRVNTEDVLDVVFRDFCIGK
eukprot:m.66425 g.66425  ORF g.66425 m.66425 type:complete len:514 (-) comp11805_c0_seq1:79-1620(-)